MFDELVAGKMQWNQSSCGNVDLQRIEQQTKALEWGQESICRLPLLLQNTGHIDDNVESSNNGKKGPESTP